MNTEPPFWSARTARENRRHQQAMNRLQIGIGLFLLCCVAIHVIEAWLR